ncbi:MAG: tRNA preQ1(34) S-adenosylmethionine ribosyltransferase-isomerase QueA [Dehalococcoidia bacterium]|nr:tRNA preQ1(34) S-adenosylmethionine ribosyltransferase-isomerase QueA [Dehalococcoidia bacterium]
MKTSDFDYVLPQELIAQTPVEPRDNSRLMVVNRADGSIEHRRFYDIVDYLRAGDVLVFNESLVIPARLHGQKEASGGQVEILLLRRLEEGIWEALVRRGKRLRIGSRVAITEVSGGSPSSRIVAEVIGQGEGGIKVIRFSDETLLSSLGKVPLPPYINTPLSHPDRYQTVYARVAGSVAAPTAGLHFTPQLLDRLEKKGVRLLFVCLHIGLDTFSPVREGDPAKHHIHREYGMVSEEVASELSGAKRQGRKVICVGTTTVRILEQVAQLYPPEQLKSFADWVSLYILPGYQFRMVDALVTNFHLPRSTLLMLATAFAGKELVNRAYQEAINAGYRFYSFGDAMLIL